MTRAEAKHSLLLYRPGVADEGGPQWVEALEQTRSDAELQRWFKEHCAFQEVMRAKFRQIPAPERFRAAILAQHKAKQIIIRPTAWWRQPAWLAAVAAVVVLLALAAAVLRPHIPDRFADYEAQMVSTALCQYRMDLVTNDIGRVRQFLAAQGAPSASNVLTCVHVAPPSAV